MENRLAPRAEGPSTGVASAALADNSSQQPRTVQAPLLPDWSIGVVVGGRRSRTVPGGCLPGLGVGAGGPALGTPIGLETIATAEPTELGQSIGEKHAPRHVILDARICPSTFSCGTFSKLSLTLLYE